MNQREFDTNHINELLNFIPVNHPNTIIGIDGACGTGKTNLSYKLAYKLQGKAIDLDDFLTVEGQSYVERLCLKKLISVIKKSFAKKHTIISGVCLLEVLQNINIKCDCLVYCREVNDLNVWHFSHNFDEYTTEASLKHLGVLEKEIVEYHKKFEPHKRANFIINLLNSVKK